MRALVATACLGALVGCQSAADVGPYQPPTETKRDPGLAEELSAEASELLDSDPEEAESLLREALTADLFCGAAHNNLGVLYLKQDRLYEAAGEFEWARKLLPGHPDPRVNLALALEAGGKTTQALAAYDAALQVYPGYLPAVMGAASLTLRSGTGDKRVRGWLEEIAMRAEEPSWAEWARERLALGPR